MGLIAGLGPQHSWCLGHELRRPQVDGNGSAATAMLGLAGFVLLAVAEFGGEVEQAVETTERVVGCPGCGVLARLYDQRPIRVRDLPAAGRAVTLVWSSGSGGALRRRARFGPGPSAASRSARRRA